MEIRQGYSYHIKDGFFDLVQDKYLMGNKENGNYRPHFLAIQDNKNEELYWMIPISSQVDIHGQENKKIWKVQYNSHRKICRKGQCFFIQNAFPIIKKFFDHVHTIENNPIMIHSKLNRELTVNLREVIVMYRRGIHLIFPDIDYIQGKMEKELNAR